MMKVCQSVVARACVRYDTGNEAIMSRLDFAISQIVFARKYTVRLLDSTRTSDWFRQPPGGVTHIAWQVGHLAMAQYRLGMERIRGRRADDEQLVSGDFLALFGKVSVPCADTSKYPSVAEIRAVFDRVHQQLLNELATLDEGELDKAVLTPHSLVQTKIGALSWCAHHEGVHAGQIGLLRRLLGHPPIW